MSNENTPIEEPSLADILSFQDDSVYNADGFNDDAPADDAPADKDLNNPDRDNTPGEGEDNQTPNDDGSGEGDDQGQVNDDGSGEQNDDDFIEDEAFQQKLIANYDLLRENGVIVTPEEFEFDGSSEKFKEALDHSAKAFDNNAMERIMQKLPESERGYFNYLINGGDDLEEYKANYINYDAVDMSSEDVQKQVIAHQYKTTTKFSDERIQKLIDRSIADGTLLDDANEAMSLLKSDQEARQQEILEANRAKAEARQEKERTFRNSVITSIADLEYLSDDRKKKVKNFYSNPVTKADGQKTEFDRVLSKINSNPTHRAQLADILFGYNEKEGLSLERLSKLKLSKKTKDFRASIHEALNTKVNIASKGNTPPSKETFDFEAFLNNSQY